MKRYRIGIVLAMMGLTVTVQAQKDVEVFWGKDNPFSRSERISMEGKRGDYLMGTKFSKGTTSLVKYSYNDLQRKNEYPFMGHKKDLGRIIDTKDYAYKELLFLKNKLYVMVSKYDRKADNYSLFAQEFDNDGRLTGNLRTISQITAESRRNIGSFEVYASQDSTKILLVNNPPFSKYAGEKFGFKILDEDLKEERSLEISLPYKDKNFSVSGYTLARIDLERKEAKAKKKMAEAGYYYEILAIDPTGEGQVIEYDISLPNKHITDISYSIDPEFGIICSGFYGNVEAKRSRDEINGIFFFRVNKETRQVESLGTKELDKQFIADLTSQRNADKGRGISTVFNLKHFVQKDDGSAILVSEYSFSYVVEHCSTDPKTGARSCSYVYHYVRNNIIAININPDGSIKWLANIPKLQHTTNDNGMFSSFIFGTAQDKMFFIYNDNPKNMDATKVKSDKDLYTMTKPKKSTTVVVTLDESGKYTKKALFNNKDNKMILRTASSLRVNDHERIAEAVNFGTYFMLIPLKAGRTKLVRFRFH